MSLEIKVNAKKYIIPNRWDELSTLQLRAFIMLIWNRFDELFERKEKQLFIRDFTKYQQAKIAMLYYILNVPKKIFLRLDFFQLSDLIENFGLLEFLFKDIELTKNHLPFIRQFGFFGKPFKINTWRLCRKFIGPGNGFAKLDGEEFSYADSQFLRFKETAEMKYLDKLIAILYRPARKDFNPEDPLQKDDQREVFNPKSIERRLKTVKRLPVHKKAEVLLWYEGNRNKLPKMYPSIFTGEKQSDANRFGWIGVLLSSAGAKFGPYEQTCRTSILLLLAESERAALEFQEAERKMKMNQ